MPPGSPRWLPVLAALGLATQAPDPSQLRTPFARPTERTRPGRHALGPAGADAILYVPPGYRSDRPTPLVILLHGAGHDATEWMQPPLLPVYDSLGAIILAPNSSDRTWDLVLGGFGPDVHRLDKALAETFRRCNIDAARIALGGFSDGASYALSLGRRNGSRFAAIIAFSPGLMSGAPSGAKPRIFVAHGTADRILPIQQTSRIMVPDLQLDGYQVTYKEFSGVHSIYVQIVREALAWFLHPPD